MSRRHEEIDRLFRNGALVQASVVNVSVLHLRGAATTLARLQCAEPARSVTASIGGHPPAGVAAGATFPVLVEPTSRYAAAFIAGKMVAAK